MVRYVKFYQPTVFIVYLAVETLIIGGTLRARRVTYLRKVQSNFILITFRTSFPFDVTGPEVMM